MEYLLTFPNTQEAVYTEKLLLDQGFAVKVMPIPALIRADCGIGLRVTEEEIMPVQDVLKEEDVLLAGIYTLDKRDGETKVEAWNV